MIKVNSSIRMALHGCYCHHIKLTNHRRTPDSFSFSSSISNPKFPKNKRGQRDSSENDAYPRFLVVMRQTELPASNSKYGTNGKAVRMVPSSEVVKRSTLSDNKVKTVNGAKQKVNGAATIVKRDVSPPLTKAVKSRTSQELPPLEELKVLPSDEGFSWANENYSSWQRSIDVWSFVISLRIRVLLDNAKWAYVGGFTEDKQKEENSVVVKGACVAAWSNFHQAWAVIINKDKVPAFSPKKAKIFIESELGAPISLLFREFEDRPIAAASLGQVHRAILHNGEKVVIKVQRPGLKKLFDIDLQNLKLIAEYFQRSETLGGPTRDWVGIYEECSTILYQEIDYINEGKNADKFRRDFRNVKWVRVPLVYWDYTAKKVLTLEYVPGIKINQVDVLTSRGCDPIRISSRAIEAYLIQILKTGFFHADPHPGNLAIDVDEALIYYDFGMMGEIKSFTRERLLELFYAVYEKDAKKVMQSLIDLGALQPTGDLSSVRRSVQFFLNNLLNQTPDQAQTFSAIGEDLFAIAQDQPFRFPSTFTFVLRAFSTLEVSSLWKFVTGIGYTLNPDFSFAKIAAPYAQELLDLRQRRQTGPQIVEQIRKQADDVSHLTCNHSHMM
ncbi:hypothetical protein Ahy_B07g088924 isoform F [Arachis hypogaea]|uniref:ABC1 atypical kinase-like domain-containing protein n=1 Tax=Arachis hypogaea TaxID=3818 RepID=A0A444YFU4_ARAHY|nr:hypothetical protein Ahy_B07g088924 isoform F [Arachis hypogaea]